MDTFRFSAGENIDLSQVNLGSLKNFGTQHSMLNIEAFDLQSDSAANALTLNLAQVLSLSQANLFLSGNGWTGLAASEGRDQMRVDGGASDSLTIAGSGWSLDGTASFNAQTYAVYNHAQAQLLVSQAMQVILA